MTDGTASTTQIQLRLDRLAAGDASARDELLNIACERLRRLARKMLRGRPRVGRWEQTDDVLQNAALRLCRVLDSIRPATVRSFINLAAVQIRRELIDLARHYDGPHGPGRHHASRDGSASPGGAPARRRRPTTLATRRGWRPGPSSTTRSGPYPTSSSRSSTSSGTRGYPGLRRPRCWGSASGW